MTLRYLFMTQTSLLFPTVNILGTTALVMVFSNGVIHIKRILIISILTLGEFLKTAAGGHKMPPNTI